MKRKRRNGQAIVEMALLFPLFLLVIVGGIIDFGFAFYNSLTLQQIANDTSQWAADRKITSSSEITSYAMNRKPSWWNRPYTVLPPETVTTTTGARLLKVTVSYDSPTYTPFYQTMMGAVSGSPNIKLRAMAAYQIPVVLGPR
jgi:Flp pilus assembly protein TadG